MNVKIKIKYPSNCKLLMQPKRTDFIKWTSENMLSSLKDSLY